MPAIPQRPLRALVTRPQAEAAELAAALARRGIEAVIEPLLEIRLLDLPAPDFAGAQAVLCTSANGVRSPPRHRNGRSACSRSATPPPRGQPTAGSAGSSAGGDVGELARLYAGG